MSEPKSGSFTRTLINRRTMPTRHILVCEDCLKAQSRIANRLKELFDNEGHVQVSYVPGAEMASAVLDAVPVDVLLLDHDMPYGNGPQLLQWLRVNRPEIYRGLHIVTFSGIPGNNHNLMAHGAHYHAQKEDVINGAWDEALKGWLTP